MLVFTLSVAAAIYLLIPALIFERLVILFVPAKQVTRSHTGEFLHGLIVVIIPIFAVQLGFHLNYWFGNHPFYLPAKDYAMKWRDYHQIVLALLSNTFFVNNSKQVWEAASRVLDLQLRFLVWMYAVLLLETALTIFVFWNFGRLLRRKLFRKVLARPLTEQISEWHILLSTFLFHPSENRNVYLDVLTSEGLYKGKIRSHFTKGDGSLTGILLDETYRFRKSEYDRARERWQDQSGSPHPGERPKSEDFWTKIAGGTHLYIPAERIGNINVRYEQPEESQEGEILKYLEAEELLQEVLKELQKQANDFTVTLRSSSPKESSQAQEPASPSRKSPAPNTDSESE